MKQNSLLVTFAVCMCIGAYVFIAVPDCLNHAALCFQSTDLAPFKYRVLQPTLERLLAPDGSQFSTLWADVILQGLFTVLALSGLYVYLKRHVNADRALLGVFITTVLMIASFHFTMRAVSTVIELACIVWALVFINRHWSIAALLCGLACLNRETGLVIGALYFASHGLYSFRARLPVPMVGSAMLLIIHGSLGSADHVLGLSGTFAYNLSDLATGALVMALLVPLWIAVISGYKASPRILQRITWIAALYAVAIVAGGAWGEMWRLALPLMPLILPVALYPKYNATNLG